MVSQMPILEKEKKSLKLCFQIAITLDPINILLLFIYFKKQTKPHFQHKCFGTIKK